MPYSIQNTRLITDREEKGSMRSQGVRERLGLLDLLGSQGICARAIIHYVGQKLLNHPIAFSSEG